MDAFARIYGIGDLTKVAAATPSTLQELAVSLAGEEGSLEKRAAESEAAFGWLKDNDLAGRQLAQLRISEMEKTAAEGRPEEWNAFVGMPDEIDLDSITGEQALALIQSGEYELA